MYPPHLLTRPSHCDLCRDPLQSRVCDARVLHANVLVHAWTCPDCFARRGANDGSQKWYVRGEGGHWIEECDAIPLKPAVASKSHVLMKVSPPPGEDVPESELVSTREHIARHIAKGVIATVEGFDGTRLEIEVCQGGVLQVEILDGHAPKDMFDIVESCRPSLTGWTVEMIAAPPAGA